MAALAVGSVVAGYRVEGLLGQGGMGAVYRARSEESGAAVALKVIAGGLADDPMFRERFRREAFAAAALDHRHVVPILEANEYQGALFLAMQLIDGVDLATLLQERHVLDPHLAVSLVAQVASGLDAAHALGLVHRDIKPANILVAYGDGEPHAYLTDFGVARRLQQRTRLTGTGLVVGTVGYLAPEALRGDGAGPAADIYALGCVLFEALTGGPPFAGDNDVAVILAHVEQQPPPLANRAAGIPAELETVVWRALAKDPAKRYASANAFARAARAALRYDGAADVRSSPITSGQGPYGATAPLATAGPPHPSRESAPTRKRVTLLYTSLSVQEGLDPELRVAATAQLRQVAEPIMERHGASIEASPTEGVMGVFGLPRLHEDDAGHAVGAAVALHEQLERVSGGAQAPISIVTTDFVLAGGDTPHASTLGGLVQEAFRLRQDAAPGDIVVSAVARDLAAASARFGPLTESGEEAVWRALGLARRREERGPRTPLVGRDRELRRLRQILDDVAGSRTGQLVSLVGEPGVGKSRLTTTFIDEVGGEVRVATTRCRPPGEADAGEPVRDLLGQLAPGSAATTIRGLLPDDEGEAVAERVERLLGLREGPVPADEVPWVVRRVLSGVSEARPLVVLFEDIHWAEDTLLELVEHVAEWGGESHLLILCSTRPELLARRPDWGEGAARAERLPLERLSETASNTLLDGLQEGTQLSAALRSRILAVAEGNPLFIEQMVGLVQDHPQPGDEIAVPPNIRSLLAARVDQLGDDERTVLTHAAVIGREFAHDELVALIGEAGAGHQLTRTLRSLARRDLVEAIASRSEQYRFRHALIRDAAHDSLPTSARAELHERHADWLELQPARAASDEAIGHHLEQAFNYRRALDASGSDTEVLGRRASGALLRAGQRAFQRDEASIAADLLERALALPWNQDSERAAALPILGEALINSGAYERAETLLQEAMASGRDSTDARLEANAAVQLASLHMSTTKANPSLLLGRVRAAIDLLRGEDDVHGLAEAHMRAGELLGSQGRIVEADTDLDAALDYAQRAGDERQVARILGLINGGKFEGPAHVDVLEAHSEYCLRWARERPERWILEASVIRSLAWVHAARRDSGRARALLEEARNAPMDRGPSWFRVASGTSDAEIYLLAGDLKAAERVLRESYAQGEELGDSGHLCSVAALLAHTLIAQDVALDEALRYTRTSEATAVEEDVHAQLFWRTARALILARDEPHVAERLAREAVRVADGTDYVVWRAHAHESLAHVLELSRRSEDALEALRTAHGLYASKGDRAKTDAVAALIGQIESDA
jgi:tetratricopeptide (TPR) repeat protein